MTTERRRRSIGAGYGAGKVLQGQLDKVLNPNWKNWEYGLMLGWVYLSLYL
jgi:hypothetical protein